MPDAGEPILLMADRQTAGGYPKIGHVIAADLPLAAQLAPGDSIEFERCIRQEAIAALIARERHLLRMAREGRRCERARAAALAEALRRRSRAICRSRWRR